MLLESLHQAVHVEIRIAVVEADDQSQRDEIGLQRIDEAASKRVARQRPSQRVDDAIEGLLRFPELFDAERKKLRIPRGDVLPFAPCLCQQPAAAAGEGRDFRRQIVRRRAAS